MITPRNKREFLDRYKQEFIDRVESEGNPKEYTKEEIELISGKFANMSVAKNKKMLKSYIKNNNATHFMYRGERHPILSEMFFDQIKKYQEAEQKEKEYIQANEEVKVESQLPRTKEAGPEKEPKPTDSD